MPTRSKAQRRWLHYAESAGKLPEGTAARWEAHTAEDAKLPERVRAVKPKKDKVVTDVKTAGIGNTTSMLKPIPGIPTPPPQQLQAPQPNNPQAALAQQTGASAPPQQPTFGWQLGANGQVVYPPGQGPVSGQVAKTASIGQLAAWRYLHARSTE